MRGWTRAWAVGAVAMVATAGLTQEGQPSRTLPFGKEWARGRELPLPYGASVTFYQQQQSYDVSRIGLDVSVLPPPLQAAFGQLNARILDVDNDVTEWNVKADAWILPCVNVYAMAGLIDGSTEVDLRSTVIGQVVPSLEIDYDGWVYGVGAVITAGYGSLFAAVNVAATETDLEEASKVRAMVVMPQIGVHGAEWAAWIGGMYQNADEDHRGNLTLTGLAPQPIPIRYTVDLDEADPWNALIGGKIGFLKHWSLIGEVGFGPRTHVQATCGYRF
jgi:hypothetical protein